MFNLGFDARGMGSALYSKVSSFAALAVETVAADWSTKLVSSALGTVKNAAVRIKNAAVDAGKSATLIGINRVLASREAEARTSLEKKLIDAKPAFAMAHRFAAICAEKCIQKQWFETVDQAKLEVLFETLILLLFSSQLQHYPINEKISFEKVFQALNHKVFSLIDAKFKSLQQDSILAANEAHFADLASDLMKLFIPETLLGASFFRFLAGYFPLGILQEHFVPLYNGTIGRGVAVETEKLQLILKDHNAVSQIQTLCNLVAKQIRTGVLEQYTDPLVAEQRLFLHLTSVFKDASIKPTDEEMQFLVKSLILNLAAAKNDQSVEGQIFGIVDLWLGKVLFSATVRVIDALSDEKKANRETILAESMALLLEKAQTMLPSPFKDLKAGKSAEEIATPAIDKSCQFLFGDIKHYLPMTEPLAKMLEPLILDEGKKALATSLMALYEWKSGELRDKEELKKAFNNSVQPEKLCSQLKTLVAPGAAFACREKEELFVTKILAKLPPSIRSIDTVETNLRGIFKLIGASQREGAIHALLEDAADNLLEPFLLKLMSKAGARIKDLEHPETASCSLLENAALRIMTEVKGHFRRLGDAKRILEENNKKINYLNVAIELGKQEPKIHRAAKVAMLAAVSNRPEIQDEIMEAKQLMFGEGLKSAQEVERAYQREVAIHDQYFVQLSKQVFELIGVTKETISPLTPSLKDLTWDLLQDTALPLALEQGFAYVNDPNTLNHLLMNISERKNDTAKMEFKYPKFKGVEQKLFETEIVDLISAFISMQKSWQSKVVGWLLKGSKAQKMLGEGIAQLAREGLRKPSETQNGELQAVTLLELFDGGCSLLNDKLAEKGVARQWFYETPEEKHDLEAAEEARIAAMMEDLPPRLKEMLLETLSTNYWEEVSERRENFEKWAKEVIEPLWFGKAIKFLFSVFMECSFFIWAGVIAAFFDFLTRLAMNLLLGDATKRRVQDVGLPHQHFCFEGADTSFDAVLH